MCAIVGWSGDLPKGTLSLLLIESEARGIDSTGIAFKDSEKRAVCYRQAAPAHVFLRTNQKHVAQARHSAIGIAHTRRASRGMPVDGINAHPFAFWKLFFAHNGFVSNWKPLASQLIARANDATPTDDAGKKRVAFELKYAKAITTDSMVLGPFIETRDFSHIAGSLGLVWMSLHGVWAMHAKKELVGAKIIWNYKKDPSKIRALTVVGSTIKIISDALAKTPDIEYDLQPVELVEGTVYKLTPTDIVEDGEAQLSAELAADEFTSANVLGGNVGEQLVLDAVKQLDAEEFES